MSGIFSDKHTRSRTAYQYFRSILTKQAYRVNGMPELQMKGKIALPIEARGFHLLQTRCTKTGCLHLKSRSSAAEDLKSYIADQP